MVTHLTDRRYAVLLLHEASRAIDRAALSEDPCTMALARASQDVHRALITLTEDEAAVLALPDAVGSDAFFG